MSDQRYTHYSANPSDLAALKRDGLGWGHDLERGSFIAAKDTGQKRGIARFFRSLRKRG